MKAIQIDGERQERKIRGEGDFTTLSCGLWMGVDWDNIVIAGWMDEKKRYVSVVTCKTGLES